jgi:hypothetical protein
MTEDFLHYIWRCGLYYGLTSDNGKAIEVMSPGCPNHDSGPDFFNAMIRIEGILLAGNVEIHVNSSDWYRHGHHFSMEYENVILQIVYNSDAEVKRRNGETIPTAEIKFEAGLLANYSQLADNEYWIPCEPFIKSADPEITANWLSGQSLIRLVQKAAYLSNVLNHNNKDWQESFYQQLARSFGFKVNGCVFEMLARSVPFPLLQRNRDNLTRLEALLFGQSGMLEGWKDDEYFLCLKSEYGFLKHKYSLKPLQSHLWKFLRLRPANFPTIRISQFAAFIHRRPGIFAQVLESRNAGETASFFDLSASAYWDTHYMFGKPSVCRVKTMGKMAALSLMINTVVPFLFFYGTLRQIPELRKRAIDFLKELPPENNSIINKWKGVGIHAESAYISQGLLQQKNDFCSGKRCLDCGIGNYIIKKGRPAHRMT